MNADVKIVIKRKHIIPLLFVILQVLFVGKVSVETEQAEIKDITDKDYPEVI